MKWGGFASLPSDTEATDRTITPTFDDLIARGSQYVKTGRPTTTEGEASHPPAEGPHKSFNYEFDEPTRSARVQLSVSSRADKTSSAQPQSLLTMQREGKYLSRKQKALLQAAAISRGPSPNRAGAKEKEEQEPKEDASEPGMETDEEKKQFRNKVWSLVGGKWF